MPRLHVPQPPTRPGDKPDFSYVDLSPAGAIKKPDVSARARDMEECATGLVRVLDDKHEPVGQWNPRLDPEDDQRLSDPARTKWAARARGVVWDRVWLRRAT